MQQTRIDRLRRLIALEIARVMDDLERRRDFLIQVWGRHRARAPFVESTFSRWTTLGMSDLAELPVTELVTIERFYRELDDLRLYLAWTEDMPRALRVNYDSGLARVKRAGELALEVLGVETGPPMPSMPTPEPAPDGWWGGDEQVDLDEALQDVPPESDDAAPVGADGVRSRGEE